MAVHFHEEDLATDVVFADGPIAVDTEAMGLVPGRDRLCLVQLSDGKGDEHLVRFKRGSDYSAAGVSPEGSTFPASRGRVLRGVALGACGLYECCDLQVLQCTRAGLSPTMASMVCASMSLHFPHQESMVPPGFG